MTQRRLGGDTFDRAASGDESSDSGMAETEKCNDRMTKSVQETSLTAIPQISFSDLAFSLQV